MNGLRVVCLLLAACCWWTLRGADGAETEAAVPAENGKMRIAVFDFSTIDIAGQKFWRHKDREADVKPMDMLSADDLEYIDERMLGLIKLSEVNEERVRRAHDRAQLDAENERERQRKDALARSLLDTSARPVVVGSEYMVAALGRYPDSFDLVDRGNLDAALMEITLGRNGAVEAGEMAQFGKNSGATHILYGVVTDFQTRTRSFAGYGVKTENTEYSLDLVVKLVDIATRRVVFSGVFTGTFSDLKTGASNYRDSGLFQNLMKSATEQAAAALYERFSAGSPTVAAEVSDALPQITIEPRGVDPADVEIYIDGAFKGNAPATLRVAPGGHELELRCGDEVRKYQVDIAGGEKFSPRMSGEKPAKEVSDEDEEKE